MRCGATVGSTGSPEMVSNRASRSEARAYVSRSQRSTPVRRGCVAEREAYREVLTRPLRLLGVVFL
jgi:hypothetical protein